MSKFGFKHYFKATPVGIRKIADSLGAAALAVSAYSYTQDYKLFAYLTLATTFIAKFISNLFTDEK